MAATCKDCEHYEFYDGPKLTTRGQKAVMFCKKTKSHWDNTEILNCLLFTPKHKEPEKTCKECSWYEYYDGPKLTTRGQKAVMFCPKIRDDPLSTLDGYSNGLGRCKSYFTPKPKEPERNCSNCKWKGNQKHCWSVRKLKITECFTPKEPPKPAEKPAEKEEKICTLCKHSRQQTGLVCPHNEHMACLGGGLRNEYNHFEPIPKPAEKIDKIIIDAVAQQKTKPAEKPKMYMGVDIGKGKSENVIMEIDAQGNVQKIIKPPKKKENKMKIGIFKFSFRRYVMACTLIVTAKIAILLHPLVCKVWFLVLPNDFHDGFAPWVCTIVGIAGVIGILCLFNHISENVWGWLKK